MIIRREGSIEHGKGAIEHGKTPIEHRSGIEHGTIEHRTTNAALKVLV
jgi:hypothetical protein